jgi:RNA polymerase sigma factor for flagellar operon FliA
MNAMEWQAVEANEAANQEARQARDAGRPQRLSILPRPTQAPPRPARRRPASAKSRRAERVTARPELIAATRPATRPEQPELRVSEQRMAELMAIYAPVVRQIVGGFQRKLPKNVLRDDLLAAATTGLWDAIRRHGDQDDEGFDWYIRVRIRGAILDELRAQDWLPRRMRSAEGAEGNSPAVVRFDDVSEWEQAKSLAVAPSSSDALEAKQQHETLARAVAQLPERERHIVAAHYFQGRKFKDLGAELGVSEPRISQLHARAMDRLRTILADAA